MMTIIKKTNTGDAGSSKYLEEEKIAIIVRWNREHFLRNRRLDGGRHKKELLLQHALARDETKIANFFCKSVTRLFDSKHSHKEEDFWTKNSFLMKNDQVKKRTAETGWTLQFSSFFGRPPLCSHHENQIYRWSIQNFGIFSRFKLVRNRSQTVAQMEKFGGGGVGIIS